MPRRDDGPVDRAATVGLPPEYPPDAGAASLRARSLAEILAEGPLAPVQAALIGRELAWMLDRIAPKMADRVELRPDRVLIDGSARVWLDAEPLLPRTVPRGAGAAIREPDPSPVSSLVRGLGELLEAMVGESRRGGDGGEPVGPRRARLLAICRKATAIDPRQRHRSLRRFAREVGSYLCDHAPEAV